MLTRRTGAGKRVESRFCNPRNREADTGQEGTLRFLRDALRGRESLMLTRRRREPAKGSKAVFATPEIEKLILVRREHCVFFGLAAWADAGNEESGPSPIKVRQRPHVSNALRTSS